MLAYLSSWRSLSAAAALFAGVALAPVSAGAVTLSLSDIAGFSMLSSTDPNTVTVNNGIIPAGTAVTITTIFAPPQNGLQSASVGLTGLNIAFNAGDFFGLDLENTNENPWTFQLVSVTDQGTFMSAAQSLIPTASASFSAALGGVGGIISAVYFVVSGNVPFPDGDRTAEYQISPSQTTVPLPAALPLFASGLGAMGLLGWRRKRKKGAALAAA